MQLTVHLTQGQICAVTAEVHSSAWEAILSKSLNPVDFMTIDPLPPQAPQGFYARFGPFGRTICEALMLTMLNIGLIGLLHLLQLNFLMPSQGNAEALQLLGRLSPVMLLVTAVVLAPILEESLFRGLPFLAWRRLTPSNRSYRQAHHLIFWGLGGLMAVAFALAHVNFKTGFQLPLPQLLFGLWSWRVTAIRGFRYSMLLHAAYNAFPATLVLAHLK